MRRYAKVCEDMWCAKVFEDMLCHATPYAPKSVCASQRVCAQIPKDILYWSPIKGIRTRCMCKRCANTCHLYPPNPTQSNPIQPQCAHFRFGLPASQPAASTASLSFGPPPIHLSTLLDLRSHLFGHSSEVLSPFPPRTYLRIWLHLASSANTPRLSFPVQITPDTS